MAIAHRFKAYPLPPNQVAGVVSKQIHQDAIILGVGWIQDHAEILTAENEAKPLVTRSVRIIVENEVVEGNPGAVIGHVMNNRGPDFDSFAMVFLDLGES